MISVKTAGLLPLGFCGEHSPLWLRTPWSCQIPDSERHIKGDPRSVWHTLESPLAMEHNIEDWRWPLYMLVELHWLLGMVDTGRYVRYWLKLIPSEEDVQPAVTQSCLLWIGVSAKQRGLTRLLKLRPSWISTKARSWSTRCRPRLARGWVRIVLTSLICADSEADGL